MVPSRSKGFGQLDLGRTDDLMRRANISKRYGLNARGQAPLMRKSKTIVLVVNPYLKIFHAIAIIADEKYI